FNRLRDKIRGRRRLPSRQSVLVFSPHPDDDVISMGGVLRKLWENENATVVAYMTSGNIAVFDHDVRRHLDFVSRAAETLGLDRAAVQRVRDGVEASFERKAPGDVDLPVVQDLKRMIRESEAIAALESVGLPAKVFAIFKHQSQKDTAPFPGGHDDREFWQRVETRNVETAARADRLGLPEYFAMEAYRIVTREETGP